MSSGREANRNINHTTSTRPGSSANMASTISLVPIQALTSTNIDGVQMTGPFILVKTTTVAQQMQAQRRLKKQEFVPKEPEMLRCKRRTDGKGLHHLLPKPQPATVARRNERERNRVKMVNLGFETLREHVPDGKKNKKLSKVDTLKSAVEYIKQLQQLLRCTEPDSNGDSENDNSSICSSPNLDIGLLSQVQYSQTQLSNNSNNNNNFENFQNEQENVQNREIFQKSNEQQHNSGHINMLNPYENTDDEIDQIENSRLTYQQLTTFNYNIDNTISFDTGSTTSGYSSDHYNYQNSYSPMQQHSPSTSYISMQHSPSSYTSDNLSESISSEEDELPDLRSWFS